MNQLVLTSILATSLLVGCGGNAPKECVALIDETMEMAEKMGAPKASKADVVAKLEKTWNSMDDKGKEKMKAECIEAAKAFEQLKMMKK